MKTKPLDQIVGAGLALMFAMATAAHARPVVSNNDGYFFDDYGDNLGVFSASNVRVAGGVVALIPANITGNFRTVDIVPTSFDQWGQLTIAGTYGAGDLTVEVYSILGGAPLISQPVNGPISLASLNSPLVTGIRVQIYFSKTGLVAPSVDSLRVTWRPVSQVLLDKQAPAEVLAGDRITYGVRYSVNNVEARGLVVFDPLPAYAAGTVVYPVFYGQDDNPVFVSATKGGLYTASGTVVNGVTVPAHSVYWNLGTVPEGTTDQLNFTVATRNGTLDHTTVTNRAYAAAANAAPQQSQRVVTTVRSVPSPFLDKLEGGGIFDIGGELQTSAGTVNTFSINARNTFQSPGAEAMCNAVVYDDVSDLLDMVNEQGTPGVPGDDFFNISPGGTFIASYDPDGGGVLPAIPAIVWNVGTLDPGASFSGSFSVRLLVSPPRMQYSNRACLRSDRTTTTCDQISVKLPLNNGTVGPPASGFIKIPSTHVVPYGGTLTFTLAANNKYAVKLNEILFFDKVRANTTFRTAWFNAPSLAASGAKIFYSTSLLFPNEDTPPPVDYTRAPSGDLDAGANAYWESYAVTPPANPAAVTWVAFYIPQLDSAYLPNQLPVALPPSTPITAAAGSFEVNVLVPADTCGEIPLPNRGLFRAYEITDLSGTKKVNPNGTLTATADSLLVVAKGYKGTLSAFSSISPDPTTTPGVATCTVSVVNDNLPTSDALANVVAVLRLSQVAVNGVLQYPTVQGISPAGTYNGSDQITVSLGLMARGAGQTIQVQLGLPSGILNDTEYTVSTTVTGQDDQCGSSTATTTARGKVLSAPKLTIHKSEPADLIPSGAEYKYSLTYQNLGTGPSTRTWIVERMPARTVFVRATGNASLTRVWFSADDNLPPQALTPLTPITAGLIAAHFTPGTLNNNGTPANLADDFWTSPFGEQTYWVAWEADEPAFTPPQFPINAVRTVGFTVRNDDNGPLAGTAGSPQGTQMYNSAAILSSELLQAIGNQVITTVNDSPSIIVEKTGPSAVEAGVPFNWVVNYHNNTLLTPDETAVITDTLPAGILFLSATHQWNSVAVANGAPGGAAVQNVVPVIVPNPDGSTSLTFPIAGIAGYRGNGVQLDGLEGGTLTLAVQSDSAACGSTRLNSVCGTATTAADTVTSCASHQVTILCPDLDVLKYATPATVLTGGTLTYQVVVANRGGIAARDVVLTDVLPAGVTYLGGLSVTPGYTIGAPSISGQTLTWSAANGNALTRTGQPAGEIPTGSGNIIIQFNVQVGAGVAPCTTLTNTAHASTVSVEEGVYPNVATATATVPPPELAVAKSGPALARPGNRVSWNITWVNQSLQAATGVYLVDTLPNNDADPDSDVTFNNIAVPLGVTPYFHSGASAPVPVFDPLDPLANGWSADSVSTVPVNHLALLVGPLAGNTGPFTAQVSVDLVDPVSHLLPLAGVSFTNRVVISQAVPLCENTTNNTATAVVRTPALDMALTKTGSVQGAIPGIAPGKPITYTLAFENTGTVNAYGVKVTDTVPATLFLGSPLDDFSVVSLVNVAGTVVTPVDLSGSPIVGAVPVTRVVSGNSVTWYLGTTSPGDALYYQKVGLPPESRGSFQLHLTVAESVADNTEVCNPATVTADVGTEDVLDNNNSESCVTVRRADVAVRKFGVEVGSGDTRFVEAGNQIQYTIEYANLGGISAQDVRIDEIVPAGTRLVSVTPPPGATVTYSPNQASATSFTVSFATLPAPANSVSSLQNPAIITSSSNQPTLFIQLVGITNLQVTWDASFTGYTLEQKTTTRAQGLASTNPWVPVVSPVIAFPGGRQGVLLPFSRTTPAVFFRLTAAAASNCSPGERVFMASANPDGFLGWSTLYVNDTIPTGASILYTVGRQTGAGFVYDLGPNYTSVSVGANGLSLSGINPAYTNLVLKALLIAADGTNGASPCLDDWQMTYASTHWPSFNFTVQVETNGCGELPVNNVVSISTTTAEITTANNSAYYNLNTRLTDLLVDCGVNLAAALPGQTLSNTLHWSVVGPQAATKSYLQIVLPDGNGDGIADVTVGNVTAVPGVTAYYRTGSTLSNFAFNPDSPLSNGWTTNKLNANHVVFLLGDQAPTSAGDITYTTIVKAGTGGQTLFSCVTGRTARRETDCENSCCTTTYIGTLANVHVRKSVPAHCVSPGELVPFTITYGNNGNTSAVNVVVADFLPPELAFVSATPAPTGPGLAWNNLGAIPGTLDVGEAGVITVMARLTNDCALVGQHPVNVATISTSSAEVNQADNQSQVALPCITADLVSLGGHVYHDGNNNGEMGLGETGIKDVLITLTGTVPCGNPVTLTTLTDQNGQYSFIGLNPGTYTVTETQPATWITTSDSLGAVNAVTRGINLLPHDDVLGEVVLNSGEVGLGYDFGENTTNGVFRLNCATNKIVECGSAWTFDPPTATNACCTNVTIIATSTVTNNIGPCQMFITRTWLAADCCNNSATCDQTVVVVDTTPPVFVCATNKTIECGATWNFDEPTAEDACWGTNVTLNILGTVTNGDLCQMIFTRTWQAMDGCSNSAACSQSVTNVDTTPPVFVCATNKTIECGATWNFDEPTAEDACWGTNVTLNILGTVTNGDLCQMIFTRTWQATDGCSNSATCSQSVTNVDTTPPVFVCATNKTIECGATWNFDEPTAVDACCGTNVTLTVLGTVTNSTGICSLAYTRTWQATDGCSNSATCSQTVAVVDTTAPVLAGCSDVCVVAPPGTNGSIVNFAVTATDICAGTLAVTCDPPSGAFLPVGQTVVTATAVDNCGNSNVCSFTVSVNLPIVANGPTNQNSCTGTTAVLCTVATGSGPFTYQWYKGALLMAGETNSCLTLPSVGASNAAAYCVVVQGQCQSVTNCATLTVTTCGGGEFCGFTQGFYGNSNGKFNGTNSLSLLTSLLAQGPMVVGKFGVRSLTITASAAALLQQRLPAGTTPATLPNNGDQNLPTATLPLNGSGRFSNVLMGQAIALSLNVRFDPTLHGFALVPVFCTQGIAPGPDGLRHTSDDVPVAGDVQTFTIPASVLSALTNANLAISNSTVDGLLELANRALAAQPTGGASLSDITAALDAINRGFDNCRALVDCATPLNKSLLGAGGIILRTIIVEPFRLSSPVLLPADNVQISISGTLGHTYTIEASADLVNWTPVASVKNTSGVVQFADPGAREFRQRYYRARDESR